MSAQPNVTVMEVSYDDMLARRIDRQWYRLHRGARFKSLLISILNTVLIGLLPAWMGHFYAAKSGAMAGVIAFASTAVFQAFVYALLSPLQAADNRTKDHSQKSWTYEMTEDHWGWTTEDGLSVKAPWTVLKLEVEMPDAYSVRAGSADVVVLKAPLQRAGVEAKFRRKLGLAEA